MNKKLLYFIFVVLSVAGAFSCNDRYEIFDELAVSSHTLNIAQTPGETHIAIYSTGTWSVRLEKAVDWASLNKLSGEGLGDFVVSWSANYGTARSVKILVTRDNLTETIELIQAGAVTSPFISLSRNKYVLPRQKSVFPVSMTTNLGYGIEDFKTRVNYYDGDDGGWISGCQIYEDRISVTAEANDSGKDRTADIVCYTTDATGVETHATIQIIQTADNPVLTLTSEEGEINANSGVHVIPSVSNNIWSLDGIEITSDATWIGSMGVIEEGLTFSVTENASGAPRSATVSVAYSAPDGSSAKASYIVHQTHEKLLRFEELRSRTPGIIKGNVFLEGFIVSDPLSPNVCSSVQTGQFSFDRTENGRTAYLEAVDGSYGFCLKFKDSADNTLPRWTKVHLSLDGISMERATAPLRYTLSGLTSDMFTVLPSSESEIPAKVKTIAQLTDADLYTYVSLQGVEILSKEGSYTNASEGYCLQDDLNPLGASEPRWDVAPLLCSDSNGDVIHILTNAAAPWRRTGSDVAWYSCLPQGAGTLSGIIVNDDVAPVRWGYLGKYQIRPLWGEEVDLNGMPFSNIICEWNWNDSVEKLTPDEGKGSFKKYDAATKFVNDYNNPYLPVEDLPNGNGSSNLKGLVAGAAISLTQVWWDYELDEGKYFDVEFSTAGLNGNNLVYGIVWGHGLGNSSTVYGPSHWKVLYSTDGGATFTELTTAGVVKQRSCAWWNSPQTSQDAAPGYTEHLFKLPSSCFGKSKVVVRMQVADLVTDIVPSTGASTWRQALGIEKGYLTSSNAGPVRIGTITVRYN